MQTPKSTRTWFLLIFIISVVLLRMARTPVLAQIDGLVCIRVCDGNSLANSSLMKWAK